MKALTVLYGGGLAGQAFEEVLSGGESAFSLAFAAASRFPGSQKTVFFGLEGEDCPLPPGVEAVLRPGWTKKSLLEELSRLGGGEYHLYFAWSDCPLLDPVLADALSDRHVRYRAEYSYADGWPYGFAPEILSPGTAGILAKIAENDEGPVERDALFSVVQKDINSFDIETEISPVDLRPWRLNLAADSKRNLLLLTRLMGEGLSSAAEVERFITEKPGLLRTLPAYFNIQVSGACPQACSICPWPLYGGDVTARKDFMPKAAFASLLDKIVDFAGDGVIGMSLWGELSLHPDRIELIEMVLARPSLSLVIETSGVGWKTDELEAVAAIAAKAAPAEVAANAGSAAPGKKLSSLGCTAPLSWIVSLDAYESERYREVRGPGFAEACSTAKTLLSLFPGDVYVQAVRVKGFEDDIEKFYRSWKTEGPSDGKHIIIQKYNDFAGVLPRLQASDLSPVKRRPCWHIRRDMNILIDGRVPSCREDLEALKGGGVWGNAFDEELSLIWERGEALYLEHCLPENKGITGICANCDEYYTYNF